MSSLLWRVTVGVLLALVLAVAAVYFYLDHWARQSLGIEENTAFQVRSGEGFSTLLRRVGAAENPDLRRAFRSATQWKLYIRLERTGRNIQAGEYELLPGDSPESVLDRLVTGEVVRYEVPLLEGWTLQQVLEALRNSPKLEHSPRLDHRGYLAEKYSNRGLSAEGMFFPDTYHYVQGTLDEEILDRAHQELQRILAQEWAARDSGLPYQSPYEALILASIIEKETGIAQDRPRIARVFINRLQRNMRLQTDPTVIYGAGEAFDGNLTRHHLKQVTPYNTYVHRGLPPTPIAMAGRAAIHAALHPAQGDYLYFVARGDGSSEFSNTLEQHRAAVRQYQLGGRGK